MMAAYDSMGIKNLVDKTHDGGRYVEAQGADWSNDCFFDEMPDPSELCGPDGSHRGKEVAVEDGVALLLDELSGSGYTSGEEAANTINNLFDLNDDQYAYREEIVAVYEFFYGPLPSDIVDNYVNQSAD